MNRKAQRQSGRGTIELVEEAVHLLRSTPASTLASYYLGALPFVLGLCFFWADMSRGAFANQRCAEAALGMALLFVWMKLWQAIFAAQLHAQLAGTPTPRLTFPRLARLAAVQALLQPTGFVVLPVALLIMLPFAWTYAFYQNVTILGLQEQGDTKTVATKAAQQACQWPRQNHLLLAILVGFGLFVFLNLAYVLAGLPELLKTFFGFETMFSRTAWSIYNTTFLTVTCCLTYLCLDPLLKAVYLLRCFYGESLQTGEDLRRLLAQSTIVGLALLSAQAAMGNEYVAQKLADKNLRPQLSSAISAPELDRAIDEVISQREYNWRLLRQQRPKAYGPEKGWLMRLLEGIAQTLRDWMKRVVQAVFDLLERLIRRLDYGPRPEVSGTNWWVASRVLLYALLALVLCALAVLIWRLWQRWKRSPTETVALPVLPVLDLASDELGANELPEAGWLQLAQQCLDRGEFRLAVRAFYLASLAHLAERDLIQLAKFKSNRDYERELGRRARAWPDLQEAFTQNVSIFDRIWYGMHGVTQGVLQHFHTNWERIRTA